MRPLLEQTPEGLAFGGFLHVGQVASVLKTTEPEVLRLIDSGELEGGRLDPDDTEPAVHRDDLVAFLRSRGAL